MGYFYSSGFYRLYPSLEPTEKIRILIGINTDRQTFQLIRQSRQNFQLPFQFSHAEVKDRFSDQVASEMEHSEDELSVEKSVYAFTL